MADALSRVNRRSTPQTERARADQVANNAGGFGFQVDDWGRALRFLILGTDGGTYYVTEKDLTKQNAEVIMRLAETDGVKLVNLLVEVSEAGRAPRQNPTLFALAVCTASKDIETRRAALAALPRVCRTGTHLFIFIRYVEQFRGWGRGLRTAVANWFTAKPIDSAAYQAIKYRQREGWSHRDLLRLSHPNPQNEDYNALFRWITNPSGVEPFTVPRIVEGFMKAQAATDAKQWTRLITEYNLPWEALPDAAMNEARVWESLLPHTGITALIRQLGRLTNLSVIAPLGGHTNEIVSMLTNEADILKGRVHPLQVLVAHATYAQGRGVRGSNTWNPVPKIIDALDEAFYMAFGSIEPADKRTLLGLDVSGSMTGGNVANSPLTPLEAEGALAMVAMRTEPEVYPTAFSQGFIPLNISAKMRLDSVLRTMRGMPFSTTDCSIPMVWAKNNKVPVDTFIVYTDSETYAGRPHPFQALREYRETSGINARLVVVAMTSNGFTIADPTDRGMLDVVGFDTATPNIVNAFSRGDV